MYLFSGRRTRPAFPCLVLFLVFALAACSPQETAPADTDAVAQAPVTAFSGARLIVGDGRVVEDGVLLVQGSAILAAGPRATTPVPPGAVALDLSGKTVMPALIDAHAHVGYEAFTGWGAEHYSQANLEDHMWRYAYYGFGAVFSAGTDPDRLALDFTAAQHRGEIGGARLLFAAGMAPPGQGPNNQFLGHALAVQEATGMKVLRGVADPQQARTAVAEVDDLGIEFVKIWVDDRGGAQEKLGAAVYRPLVDEARQRGMSVFVHQQAAEDMADLVSAGVNGFLHGRLGELVDQPLATEMGRRGIFLVPNLGLGELRREAVAEDPFLQESLAPAALQRLLAGYENLPAPAAADAAADLPLAEALARLLGAGADVVLGTDAGAVPDHFFGYTGHRELEIFVRLGMTPLQALEAGTAKAARHLRLDDAGTLDAGKRADFLILDANPLEDIRNTRSLAEVYLGGQRVDRDGLRRRWQAASGLP